MNGFTESFAGRFARLRARIAEVFRRKPKSTATRRYSDIDMVTLLVACEQGWNGALGTVLALKGVPELNRNFHVVSPSGEELEWHLPLELAVRARSPRCARMLLACGADPKARCRKCGMTPLRHADPVMRFVLKHRPDKLKFYECTDAEFAHYEALRSAHDEFFWSRMGKFYHHPAVYHTLMRDLKGAKRVIYPLVMGDYSDEEIRWVLDKIAPPGRSYF